MEKKWWHGKVAYQIYPKSFCDSNGDGIGDLQGIIGKLDYLRDLGIDIIWISPVYQSPMADQGYDISDYYKINPIFGTMEDMETLLREARKRNMYIVMDLVVNHCSDEHIWFREACREPEGKYGNYFYIARRNPDGSVPCNWRGYFGGSVWEPLPGHPDRVYLHVFHKKQPDLNWENPELRQEIYRMINWWLEKGLAGFRIDAIINIKKKLPFRDYPADRADGLSSMENMLADAEGVEFFLQEMAENTFRKYDAFTVGEVFGDKPEELPGLIGDGGCFSTIFDFAETCINTCPEGWYQQQPVTAEQYKKACFASQRKAEGIGFLSNIIENHDEPRGVSHYLPRGEHSEAAKKLLGGLNFLLKGLPFLFEGQEIGMENTNYESVRDIDDIAALGEYRNSLEAGLTPQQALRVAELYSRDNARTPVQWDESPNGGFTTGKPWLPVNSNYRRINVAEQLSREDSVLNFYRRLIALRKDRVYGDTLIYGTTIPYLENQKNLMAYWRKGEKDLLILGNFQKKEMDAELPGSIRRVLLNNLEEVREKDGVLHLEGYQLVVLEIGKE